MKLAAPITAQIATRSAAFSVLLLCSVPSFAQAPAAAPAAVAPGQWALCGGEWTTVVERAGQVWSWGLGAGGALGDGKSEDRATPRAVADVKNARSVAAGRAFAVAARTDGTVAQWGLQHGAWEKGTTPSIPTPRAVSGLANVDAVAAGQSFAVALLRNGNAFAWGSNNAGQLGDGTGQDRAAPAPVKDTGALRAVACGSQHALGLRLNGSVVAWGKNADGQLGDGTFQDRSTPVSVIGLSGIKAVAAGWNWSLALDAQGRVWGWGSSLTSAVPVEEGEAPLVTQPKLIAGLDGITAIAAGNWHAVALRKDGTVLSWGNDGAGQLGSAGGTTATPRPVKDLSDVAAIACGGWHNLALKNDGTLWAWGSNATGQVGDGTKETHGAPVKISF